jgi:hypothetical protein
MEPIQEKRELLIEEDEIQLQLLQEKIRLKKEMKQNYIISSYIEINSQYFEWRENKYNLSFPETIEPEMTEDENNYIRFKLLDEYTRDPVIIDIKCKMIREYNLKMISITVSYNEFHRIKLQNNTLLCDEIVTPVITIKNATSLQSEYLDFPEDYVRLFLPTCLSVRQDFSCIYEQILLIQCNKITEKTETWEYINKNKNLPELYYKIIGESLYFVSNITSFTRYCIAQGWLPKSIKNHALIINRNK